MLTEQQLAQYNKEGFVILRGAISESDIKRLERGVANNPPLDGTLDPNAPQFPDPGRYTLATQCARDPDLAFIIEHETIVGAVTDALEDDPVLTAYVIYDRTPMGNGLPPHHDYKRWRPVGGRPRKMRCCLMIPTSPFATTARASARWSAAATSTAHLRCAPKVRSCATMRTASSAPSKRMAAHKAQNALMTYSNATMRTGHSVFHLKSSVLSGSSAPTTLKSVTMKTDHSAIAPRTHARCHQNAQTAISVWPLMTVLNAVYQ